MHHDGELVDPASSSQLDRGEEREDGHDRGGADAQAGGEHRGRSTDGRRAGGRHERSRRCGGVLRRGDHLVEGGLLRGAASGLGCLDHLSVLRRQRDESVELRVEARDLRARGLGATAGGRLTLEAQQKRQRGVGARDRVRITRRRDVGLEALEGVGERLARNFDARRRLVDALDRQHLERLGRGDASHGKALRGVGVSEAHGDDVAAAREHGRESGPDDVGVDAGLPSETSSATWGSSRAVWKSWVSRSHR